MSENQTDIIAELSAPRYAPRLKPTLIPTARWDEEPLLCLKVNDEWVSHLLGVIVALDQPDTWLGTADQIYDARQQVNEIMLAFMEQCDPMSNCCPEPLTRLTEDGGMEVSYDGGMTWQDATTEDPRNTAPQLPPLAGSDGNDKRCKAANNVLRQMKELQKEWSNNLGAGLSVLQLALTFAAGIAALFITGGAIAPIVVPALLTLAAGVVGTGQEAYDDLFTSDVWDYALCQFYCEAEPDGTYTSSGFNNILANFDTEFTGNLALAFSAALTGWQLPGLNQAAKIPSTDNLDCSDCCPTCGDTWDTHDPAEPFYGTITERGDGYMIVQFGATTDPGGQHYIWVEGVDENDCCNVTVEALSGGWLDGNNIWVECGQPNQDIFHASKPIGESMWSLLIKTTVAGSVVKVIFG